MAVSCSCESLHSPDSPNTFQSLPELQGQQALTKDIVRHRLISFVYRHAPVKEIATRANTSLAQAMLEGG